MGSKQTKPPAPKETKDAPHEAVLLALGGRRCGITYCTTLVSMVLAERKKHQQMVAQGSVQRTCLSADPTALLVFRLRRLKNGETHEALSPHRSVAPEQKRSCSRAQWARTLEPAERIRAIEAVALSESGKAQGERPGDLGPLQGSKLQSLPKQVRAQSQVRAAVQRLSSTGVLRGQSNVNLLLVESSACRSIRCIQTPTPKPLPK